MKILMVAGDILGYGGIPFFNRMLIQAICETRSIRHLTCISRIDSNADLQNTLWPCTKQGMAGNKLRFALRLGWLLHREHWDLVIFTHVNLTRLLPFCIRVPNSLIVFHGIEVWTSFDIYTRFGVNLTRSIMSVSRYTACRTQMANSMLANRTITICQLGYTCLETEVGEVADANTTPYILSIGRMEASERYKGFDELIHIWPRFLSYNPQFMLYLIGDGSDRQRLEELAMKTSCRIQFLGRVTESNKNMYLRHCTAFALPSSGEGFGLVFLEAMSEGKAVLCGSVDAAHEIVMDHVTGRVVNPKDPDRLLDGLLDVAGNNSRVYGAAGKQRYLQEFTFFMFQQRFVRVLDIAIEKRY